MTPNRILYAIIVALILNTVIRASAHDSWISNSGARNLSGEWCCGENDCAIVKGVQHVTLPMPGYRLHATSEFVSERDTQSSPDGSYWRCQRPNGSLRCFFAPPEGM
jgi:hypothetical protein